MNSFNLRMKGEYWDEIYEMCPITKEPVLVRVTEKITNTIVDSSKQLVASLLAQETGMSTVTYHAFGVGDAAWDTANPIPSPAASATQLVSELGRVPINSIVFLDGSGDVLPAGQRSLVLRIKTIVDYNDFNGQTIREHALFGGNATTTVNSGIMLNTLRTVGQFKGNTRVVKLVKLTIL